MEQVSLIILLFIIVQYVSQLRDTHTSVSDCQHRPISYTLNQCSHFPDQVSCPDKPCPAGYITGDTHGQGTTCRGRTIKPALNLNSPVGLVDQDEQKLEWLFILADRTRGLCGSIPQETEVPPPVLPAWSVCYFRYCYSL